MTQNSDNLDLDDVNNLKDVWVHEAVVYSGNTKIINDQTHEAEPTTPILAAAVLGLNNTANPTPHTSKYANIWTDIDAQEMYLNEKPTCYLIVGKPGLGAFSLGEAMAKKYNCIHLCPRNIINDEIMQGSFTGNCLDFNMKHNKICTYRAILKMLKQKLKSPTVHHRGYVISGIPIITANQKPYWLVIPKHSEEAAYVVTEILIDLIANLKKKKPAKKPTTSGEASSQTSATSLNVEEDEQLPEEEAKEEEVPEQDAEEQEVVAALPKFHLHTCSKVFFNIKAFYETTQAGLLQQLQEIFHLSLKPDIIIYITCPDADVITKKSHKYINYKNGQYTVEPFTNKVEWELRWPSKYNLSEYQNPHDMHVFNPKYNCRPPLNFRKKSIDQICNYRDLIFPFIEKKIMDYDPQHVIKLDGRTSTHQMMYQVSERLLLMDIKPIFIPEPLYMEEPPEDLEEFWKIVEESNIIQSGVLKFKRYASPWFNRCPVELKKRQSVQGKPKFAVMFFKHVYLLSSLPNFISFCRNPRPYLKLHFLEPTCRIIVLGTKSSGKSMTAECLSWIFDTPVINFKNIYEVEHKKKYETFAKTILSEIIATIEDARLTVWQRKEYDRMSMLKEWNISVLKLLKEYISLLIKYQEHLMAVSQEQDIDEDYIAEEEKAVLDPDLVLKYNIYRERLSFLPIIDSVEECESVLKNQNVTNYGPLELTTSSPKPTLPVLGDEDVNVAITEYIVANDLKKEIEPTTEEIMNAIIHIISTIDSTHHQETNARASFGKFIIDDFPSDPEHWGYLSDANLLPDYTITIMENRELEPELIINYLNIEKCTKNYYETILSVKDPLLILSKQQKKKLSQNKIKVDVQTIVDSVIHNSTDPDIDIINTGETENPTTTEPSAEAIASFTESVERFREDWDNIKVKLEDKFKCYIEVELENRTDVEVLEEVLLKIRQCYFINSEPNEDEEIEVDDPENILKDLLSYNNPQTLCETNIYCPYTFFNYGVLWEGKQEFSIKYDNKIHYLAKEEFVELFQRDITKYQAYNKPIKKWPKLKICVTGCIGSGTTTLSKRLATELGLLHIDLAHVINNYYMPRHYKKVGRPYENPFQDGTLEEEGVVEFQMDEENPNLLADILANENEFRRMIYNYYERAQPILPVVMHKIIMKLWSEYPFASTGFVLDGYPRLPQDIEDMVHCICIPDSVIVLDCPSETTVERLGPAIFKKWKLQLKEAKEAHRKQLEREHQEWMNFITKKVVIKVIIEEILEKLEDTQIVTESQPRSVESFIVDANPGGSSNVDPKLFSAYNEIIEEFPMPIDTREWDVPAEVRENIDARLEAIHEADLENIETIKDMVLDNKIKQVTIDASKPFYKVFRKALSKLTHLRNRTNSFLEQTYIITTDIADVLLSQGYCFLSKFGRLCPVYVYEHPNMILHTYKISRRKGKLFPVVHRAYVYFISSEENVIKFRTDPLKYIISEEIRSYKTYPLRIGIIGTLNAGKSTLAASLSKLYNLMGISRGKALRSVLDNMQWTELASKISKKLYNGEIVDVDDVMSAVQTVAIDHRTVTYGFVLDGFPSTPSEAMFLSKHGLYPNIIFDISSSKEVIVDNSQNEIYYDILKYKPPYSHSFIENRYNKWSEQCYKIKKWINNDYQNICAINGNSSKWQVWKDATDAIKDIISKINYYLINVGSKIVPAKAMAISNEIFEQKASSFKNFCPACLRKNILRHSGFRGDKRGVVQYKNKLYWICDNHLDVVIMFPDYYLSKSVTIPEVPAIVNVINIDNVYENGICIVTYAENLPGQRLKRGTNEFAATYKNKTYLFCSENCLHKFVDKPHLYSDITVFKASSLFPRLSLKKLPDLGYLEQTLANILTEACCSVNAVRPKYPGLTFPHSALIYIALYLKTHNPRLPKEKFLFYQKALKIFESRSKLILDLGLRMRSMENPFSNYPKCRHGDFKKCSSVVSVRSEISSTGSRPSTILPSSKETSASRK